MGRRTVGGLQNNERLPRQCSAAPRPTNGRDWSRRSREPFRLLTVDDRFGLSPLEQAVDADDRARVASLLAGGVDPNETDSLFGAPRRQIAFRAGNYADAELFARASADLDLADDRGCTHLLTLVAQGPNVDRSGGCSSWARPSRLRTNTAGPHSTMHLPTATSIRRDSSLRLALMQAQPPLRGRPRSTLRGPITTFTLSAF